MTKVGKSDGEGTFAGTRGNDKVAPIPDLPALALEWRGPTHNNVQEIRRMQSSHAEIGPPYPVVGGQGPMRAFEDNPAGFEHIPVIARVQSFRHTLLYQEQGDAVLAVEHSDTVEDQIGDGRSKPHGWLVEEQ